MFLTPYYEYDITLFVASRELVGRGVAGQVLVSLVASPASCSSLRKHDWKSNGGQAASRLSRREGMRGRSAVSWGGRGGETRGTYVKTSDESEVSG